MTSDYRSALLKLFVLLCGVFCITSTLALPADSKSDSLPLGALVPKISQKDFKLTPEGNGYHLFLNVPEGAYRKEDVTLINKKELSVKGEFSQRFGVYVYKSDYVADGHGYRVKYKYQPRTRPRPPAPTYRPPGLSAQLCKTACG